MSDTITLIQRSQQGDRDASERLVTENTGLIWSIARRYFGRGVEPDDLFQLGCVGFLKAVEGHLCCPQNRRRDPPLPARRRRG